MGGETTEATSASSSGQYSTPSWVAPNKSLMDENIFDEAELAEVIENERN